MRAMKAAVAVGATAVLIGVLLGFMGTSIPGPGGATLSCGSAWSSNEAATRRADFEDARSDRPTAIYRGQPSYWGDRCSEAIGSRTGWAVGLLAVGLLTLGVVGTVRLTRSIGAESAQAQ